jgi:hypothetical protein
MAIRLLVQHHALHPVQRIAHCRPASSTHPNWTSPAFSKFVDATRALVDELANITTTRDGREEMVRCEEIFRQICWLEQRFWPDVDGMGEEDESAKLDPQVGIGGFTGPLNQNMNGPMNSNTMTGQMSGQMNGQMNGNAMNGQMNGPMNPNGMNGPMSNTHNAHNANQMSGPSMSGPMSGNHTGNQLNGPSMSGPMSGNHNGNQINGQGMNSNDNTPGPDGGNMFGQTAS